MNRFLNAQYKLIINKSSETYKSSNNRIDFQQGKKN